MAIDRPDSQVQDILKRTGFTVSGTPRTSIDITDPSYFLDDPQVTADDVLVDVPGAPTPRVEAEVAGAQARFASTPGAEPKGDPVASPLSTADVSAAPLTTPPPQTSVAPAIVSAGVPGDTPLSRLSQNVQPGAPAPEATPLTDKSMSAEGFLAGTASGDEAFRLGITGINPGAPGADNISAEERKRREDEADYRIAIQIAALDREEALIKSQLEDLNKLDDIKRRRRGCEDDIKRLESRVNHMLAYIERTNPAVGKQLRAVLALDAKVITADIALNPGDKPTRMVISKDDSGRMYVDNPNGTRMYIDQMDAQTRARIEKQVQNQQARGEKFGNEDPAAAADFTREHDRLQKMPGASRLTGTIFNMYDETQDIVGQLRVKRTELQALKTEEQDIRKRLKAGGVDPDDPNARDKLQSRLKEIQDRRTELRQEVQGIRKTSRQSGQTAWNDIVPQDQQDAWRARRAGPNGSLNTAAEMYGAAAPWKAGLTGPFNTAANQQLLVRFEKALDQFLSPASSSSSAPKA